MSLTIDLRFSPAPADGGEGDWITLGELVPVVRRPRELCRLLWGSRRERLRVLVDELPPTAVQAGALLLAGVARARSFEIVSQSGARELARVRLLAEGVARSAAAIPSELIGSWRVHRHARRILDATEPLPRRPERFESVAYLRAAPTMRYLGEYVGGAAAHTSGVLAGLTGNGLTVDVYATERPQRVDSITFHEVPLQRLFHLAPWLTVTAYSRDLVGSAAQRRPDFIYQRYALGSLAGLELARSLEIPLVLEYNGSEIWTISNWGSGRIPMREMLTEIEQRNVSDASLVVVVSDVLREELIARGEDPDRILVNPNGVDVEALTGLRSLSPAERRSRLALPDTPTVGFVGTFGLWHGVKLLPEMVESVTREVPEARWILIGDGQLHPEVHAEIESRGLTSRVSMTGVVPHPHAVELLAACDVCVSPHVPNPDGTRFFGSPTKLFEYMGLGKAIVAADLEQIGDVLEHGRTALLHEPGDVSAAAASVVRLLNDRALRAALGNAALTEAATRYSWDAHVSRILAALGRPVMAPVDATVT